MEKEKPTGNTLLTTKYRLVSEGEQNLISEEKKPDTLYLIFAMLTGSLILFTGGSVFAWTSPVIPKLQSNDSAVNPLKKPITTEQISLLSGLPIIISLIGSFGGPIISDVIGRKRTLQIIGLVMVGCDLMTAFSKDITLIIISKCISITFYVGTLGVVPMYTTEVCEDYNRGKYGCLLGIFLPLGTLYAYILGPIFSVKVFTLLTTVPVVAFLVFFCFAPESPIFLLSKGRRSECKKTLRKLRNNKNITELVTDLDKLEETLKLAKNRKNSNVFTIFRVREGRIGLLLAGIPSILQFAAGGPILIGFMAPVFNEAGTSISGNTVAIIVGIVNVISVGFATFLVDKFGRRILLICSALISCSSAFLVGLYFYLKHLNHPVLSSIPWLPIASIIIFISAYSFGVGSVPPTLLGELFTHEFRSAAISFIMTLLAVFLSVLAFGFPLAAKHLGIHWCMWYFSFNCLWGAIFTYIMLPETKCKSILEIQLILQNYKFNFKKPI